MKAPCQSCDDQLLQSLLSSENEPLEQEEVMAHVEQCSHCQRRLEQLAATAEEWRKAGDSLTCAEAAETEWYSTRDGERNRIAGWLYASAPRPDAIWTDAMAKQLLAPPSHPELLGRLGRYDVERMIGVGGMGVVFKAFDSELNRPVAVKVLAPFLWGSGSARKRFTREARAAAAIVHEHVVPIHNVETEQDSPFLVMQYIAGESLQSRIDRTGPLQVCEILRIGKQIASGLSAAHQQGLIHRDIKPSNILLEQGVDRALITDFGLARAADDAALTSSGIHPGTPQFMSPEQAAGDAVDARSDLFSLGSVLYTMSAGRPPFRSETCLGVLRRIADDEPRSIREINPNIPEWLCIVIAKLMAKDPRQRYASAAEVAALLEQCLAHVQKPDSISLPAELDPPRPNRSRWPAMTRLITSNGWAKYGMVGAGLLAVLLVVAFLANPPNREKLSPLQGEWLLVSSERSGQLLAQDQLFNERLIVRDASFRRPQTAPDGRELDGESGKFAFPDEPPNAIDMRMWEGTAHGIYRLTNDELVLCVTRNGGARPDSFLTKAGDDRVMNTYRRVANSQAPLHPPATLVDPELRGETSREWIDPWIKKITSEIPPSSQRDVVVRWLSKHGFRSVKVADITVDVMKQIHPHVDAASLEKSRLRSYVHGVLSSNRAEGRSAVLEVYFLFDDKDLMQAIHVGPLVTVSPPMENSTKPQDQGARGSSSRPRFPSLMTRPLIAENAPVIVCVGPERPMTLGDTISQAEVLRGIPQEVVRIHVWDWSSSDVSRVLLIQRSEWGALAPDGSSMLTLEGETLSLRDKQTRQYSGFKVPEGQRLVATSLSPSQRFAAATIHLRTDWEIIPTDPPAEESRNSWKLRLLQLDTTTFRGQKIDEFPFDARSGIAFASDEKSMVYVNEQQQVVRRHIASERVFQSYEPALGVHGAAQLAISPDQRYVAAASYSESLFVWEAASGKLCFHKEASEENADRPNSTRSAVVRFSPDGGKIAWIVGQRIRIVEAATGEILRDYTDQTGLRFAHVQWSKNDDLVSLVSLAQAPLDKTNEVGESSESTPRSNSEQLPRVYTWKWATEMPIVKQYRK